MTAPSRSALFSFSDRKTMPLPQAFLRCSSKWRAIKPKGAEEEIAVRGEDFLRFDAPLAAGALLERTTLNPPLFRDQFRLIARAFPIKPILLAPTPMAGCIREFRRELTSRSIRPLRRRFGAEAPRSYPLASA
jgi:hypothetical protein